MDQRVSGLGTPKVLGSSEMVKRALPSFVLFAAKKD